MWQRYSPARNPLGSMHCGQLIASHCSFCQEFVHLIFFGNKPPAPRPCPPPLPPLEKVYFRKPSACNMMTYEARQALLSKVNRDSPAPRAPPPPQPSPPHPSAFTPPRGSAILPCPSQISNPHSSPRASCPSL